MYNKKESLQTKLSCIETLIRREVNLLLLPLFIISWFINELMLICPGDDLMVASNLLGYKMCATLKLLINFQEIFGPKITASN